MGFSLGPGVPKKPYAGSERSIPQRKRRKKMEERFKSLAMIGTGAILGSVATITLLKLLSSDRGRRSNSIMTVTSVLEGSMVSISSRHREMKTECVLGLYAVTWMFFLHVGFCVCRGYGIRCDGKRRGVAENTCGESFS
ncbi:hypothetical protein ACLOJK_007009 [Asimina triloba]